MSDTNLISTAVIVGGSSAIGMALARLWAADTARSVIVLSRSDLEIPGVRTIVTDYSDGSLATAAEEIRLAGLPLARLVVTNGILSNETIRPERKVGDLNPDAFSTVMSVNALLPMRSLAAFWSLIRQSEDPRIAILSARVGSLEDNQLGGWYSYRASKAALNMMMKCAAVDLRRVNKQAKLIAYHPGTVDSPLSKPFQRSVPDGKLFTPEFSALRLIEILDNTLPNGDLDYVDWAGKSIPW